MLFYVVGVCEFFLIIRECVLYSFFGGVDFGVFGSVIRGSKGFFVVVSFVVMVRVVFVRVFRKRRGNGVVVFVGVGLIVVGVSWVF